MLRNAVQDINIWINEIAEKLNAEHPRTAYHALRRVLFALRDRLLPQEAVHFGYQLPVLLRGIYYQSYQLGGKPEKLRSVEAFLEKTGEETSKSKPAADPKRCLMLVPGVLARRIDGGQYRQIKHALPKEIEALMA